jgi:hypothetical protein
MYNPQRSIDMTKKILLPNGSEIVVIEPEDDDVCKECGRVDELRPYGENYKRICFDCGQKNPELAERMMNIVLFGE